MGLMRAGVKQSVERGRPKDSANGSWCKECLRATNQCSQEDLWYETVRNARPSSPNVTQLGSCGHKRRPADSWWQKVLRLVPTQGNRREPLAITNQRSGRTQEPCTSESPTACKLERGSVWLCHPLPLTSFLCCGTSLFFPCRKAKAGVRSSHLFCLGEEEQRRKELGIHREAAGGGGGSCISAETSRQSNLLREGEQWRGNGRGIADFSWQMAFRLTHLHAYLDISPVDCRGPYFCVNRHQRGL